MKCRVCRVDDHVRKFGHIQPYLDFECSVYHCEQCESRFTERDGAVYEMLHSDTNSSYAYHRKFASRAAEAYQAKDLARLGSVLSVFPKYKFVIDALNDVAAGSNILEVGCSRGHLTSYFLLAGHQVLGTDVSESAIRGASELFGPNFCVAGSEQIEQRAPFDVIYHVGTIGCVESPIELTDQLLDKLKPGGILAFNAPNVAAAVWQKLAWVRGTYPPDLVCLFHEDLWAAKYGACCDVHVEIEKAKLSTSLIDAYNRGNEVVATSTLVPKMGESSASNGASKSRKSPFFDKAERVFWRGVDLLTPYTSRIRRPTDFGMYVVMRKRTAN